MNNKKPIIQVINLKKSFKNYELFRDLNLNIEKKRITAIFGPNGCGKSTLFEILAGLAQADSGVIKIENINHYKFSYVFQNYRESLLPWRNNFANISFPLEIQRLPAQEILKKVKVLEKFFGLKFKWGGYPYELSGGQQQILAFMRALITKPRILLIDEPFSALDYENNLVLRELLQKYYLAYKPTILLVTHNIEEAVHLAGRIIILSQPPTQVFKIVEIPLKYPRTLRSLKSRKFANIKEEVLSVFQHAAHL